MRPDALAQADVLKSGRDRAAHRLPGLAVMDDGAAVVVDNQRRHQDTGYSGAMKTVAAIDGAVPPTTKFARM
ncbi:hypothetical protein D3C80_2139930 [compost metagenome]